MSGKDWETFADWAVRVNETADLAKHEHSYKRNFANKLAKVREEFVAGDISWRTSLVQALQGTNLLHYMTVSKVKTAAAERPAEFDAAVAVFWSGGMPSVDVFPNFEPLIKNAIEGLTPGNVTALGALLLMGRDAEQFPPYRATPVKEWSELVGLDAPGASPAERYQRLLALCDELLNRRIGHLGLSGRLEAQGLGWAVVKWPADDIPIPDEEREALRRWRGDMEAGVSDRGVGPAPAMEAAAWELLSSGLTGRSSALVPASPCVWTDAAAADLLARISVDPGSRAGGFLERLLIQLNDASDETKLLAAELLYIISSPPSSLTAKRKVKRVQTLLHAINPALEIPDSLRSGLEANGAFEGGQGYNAQIAKQFGWLCRFVLEWTETDSSLRAKALSEPLTFAAISAGVSGGLSVAVEHSLNYLVWPGHLSPVISKGHRKRIRDAFSEVIGGATGDDSLDVTRDLMRLRRVHEDDSSDYANWYRHPHYEVWNPKAETDGKAWLVRATEPAQITADIDGRSVMVNSANVKALPAGSDLGAVQKAIDAAYPSLEQADRSALGVAHHGVLTRVQEGHMLVTVIGENLRIGTVISDAAYNPTNGGVLSRDVEWSPAVYALKLLPASVSLLLEMPGALVDVSGAWSHFADLLVSEMESAEDMVDPLSAGLPALSPVTVALASHLHMHKFGLQEMVDVLQLRQQIVLYGPPGTGKTYVARALADHLVGEDQARLVQLHPSYSYEDFFEGYRPTVTPDGQAAFKLQHGPLRQLAEEASQPQNRTKPFVLIVDEMNRANLAKVFGELYFLLEYRNESVQLQYSPGDHFRLPPNLFIIGTMNTADRSIAMVDAAIRRRFAFIEMHPAHPPVQGVLDRYLADRDGDERGPLLAALNAEIGREDHDLQIGPSYLMRDHAATAAGLEQVWRFDILPLLEEHYYGRIQRHEVHRRFGLNTLRAVLRKDVGEVDVGGVAVEGVVTGDPGPQ